MSLERKMTVGEVANVFGVTPATVRRWSDDGSLPSTRTLGGARRYDPTVVQEKLRDATR